MKNTACSFLKKRTKKLLPVGTESVGSARRQTGKSFLLLFFKKEALAFFLLLVASPALAISDPSEMLRDPAQEARAEAIGSQLRCLVCQNESIEDSGADLARDLRTIVRQRVVVGDSDKQVIAWMVARYGNFVRLRPPFDAATALLWLSPVLAVAAGLIAAFLSRRRATVPLPPLSDAERQRLESLTRS